MKDLQAIVDKRAEDKLNTEIREIHNFLYSKYELLSQLTINTGTIEKPQNMSLHRIFDATVLSKKIFDVNIEKYKEKESEKFIKEMEVLRTRVNEISEQIGHYE